MPAPVSYPAPVRIEAMPGDPFGVAILPGPRAVSGVAIGSMVAGIGSLLVAIVVWCFGLMGAEEGWGGIVSGAFCALSVLLGVAACALGGFSLRQMRRQAGMSGKGMAITGLICGGVGIIGAISGLVLAILLAAQMA